MRMTRAALRAQEAEEELQAKIDGKLRDQGLSLSQTDLSNDEPMIYEDFSEDSTVPETSDSQEAPRQALRDITQENYPVAETVLTSEQETYQVEEPEIKSTKKVKSKNKKKTGGTRKEPLVDEHQQAEPISENLTSQSAESSNLETSSDSAEMTQESVQAVQLQSSPNTSTQSDQTASNSEEDVSENREQPAPSSQSEEGVSEDQAEVPTPETPSKTVDTIAKTPRFNPEIHLSSQPDINTLSHPTEDSFVESIKTRSPSKLSRSTTALQVEGQSDPFASTPARATPQKIFVQQSPSSSQRIEDSVEAIDALEDAIEKFAEDLPVIEALPFESPVRSRKTPARTPSMKSKKAAAETPCRITEKTPLKSATKSSKKPAQSVAVAAKISTPPVSKIELRSLQISTARATPPRKETVRDRVRAIESKPSPAVHRRVTSVNMPRRETSEARQTQRPRHMATKSVPTVAPIQTQSMSFSNSPAKQTANQPKKRVTSSGALSTSRPGFVPAKSTKPTTAPTFTLPGEAIAAKLKAQREERAKREESELEKKPAFKARPAPVRAARPSVMPRDNKTSAARIGIRQASGGNKENVAPVKVGPTTKSNSTASAANTSARRTTIAPKATATVESRKANASGSPDPDVSARRVDSLSAGQPSVLTKADSAQQRLKGREVYGRIKGTVQQQEDEKKAKEEAARKARAEAAERGRQASREWAEKQKKKAAAAAAAAAATSKPAVVETEA